VLCGYTPKSCIPGAHEKSKCYEYFDGL
jgi:hypothetical protein